MYGFAGVDALAALGTGEHQPFDIAWLEPHRADMVAKRLAIGAVARAFALITDYHRLAIGHPDQTLKHPCRAGVTTEQMPGQSEFDEQQHGANADE